MRQWLSSTRARLLFNGWPCVAVGMSVSAVVALAQTHGIFSPLWAAVLQAGGWAGSVLWWLERSAFMLPVGVAAQNVSLQQDVQALPQPLDILRRQVRAAIDKSEGAVMQTVTTLTDIQRASTSLHAEARQAIAHSNEVSVQIRQLTGESQQALQSFENHQQALSALQSLKDAQVTQAMLDVQGLTPLLGMIKDIAKQTHLLSFNAAIEAARAGHTGSGFKIVATEVRHLAQQTSDVAKQIEEGIVKVQRTVQNNSSSGADELARMLGSVQDIRTLLVRNVEQSQQLGPYLQQLSHGVDSSTVQIKEQVSHSLAQMQFQDILRQILEQVEQGLQMLSDCSQSMATGVASEPRVQDLAGLWEGRYVMQDQRIAHQNGVTQASHGPDIELF